MNLLKLVASAVLPVIAAVSLAQAPAEAQVGTTPNSMATPLPAATLTRPGSKPAVRPAAKRRLGASVGRRLSAAARRRAARLRAWRARHHVHATRRHVSAKHGTMSHKNSLTHKGTLPKPAASPSTKP